ncbi:MAG TPA: tRNA-dihydrouridine synthase [Patescibacteria group bacterium]|nr:tRNA-dihydrouridine synthase [Patescibacteria group bacterium]
MTLWDKLPKPIFSLAPMEDVTNTVFRRIILSCGRPDVFFTEFTNVDGLYSAGKEQVAKRLQFSKEEKPIVAQIWGIKPENYYKGAKDIVAMGFDGIDINMGCPQSDVIKKGYCAALINNHTLAKEIIQATQEGSNGKIPVSIKTRLGIKRNQREEWIGFLLDQQLAVITIHGRTVAEMSKVPAHWNEIGNVVTMRNKMRSNTLIFGNGDIQNLKEAREKVTQYGVDGIMIGRGIFHNPWLFNENIRPEEKTVHERMTLLLQHIHLFKETWGDTRPFAVLKKYFKIYLSGFEGAGELRVKFMETNTLVEAENLAQHILS